MVLVCRDAHIGCDAVALFVEFVFVEEDAARRLDAAGAFARLRRACYLLVFKAFCQKLVNHGDARFDNVEALDELGDGVHIRVAAALLQSEHFCGVFGHRR